jgi:hypothetical protein
LAKPVSVTSGVSARHAQIEARIARTAKVRTIAADNPTIYNPATGVLLPASGGTGTVNVGTINTGGGDISNTGGGNIDLGTGVGIGGPGVSAALGTGTAGRVAEWASTTTLQAATLIKSGAGVLTLSASSTVTLTIDNSIRLANSGASSGDVLTYDGSKYAPVAPTTYAPVGAKYIVQTADATLTNEQALASLSTGMVKVTTTTGVLSSVSGTSGRITEWSDGTTIGASTLIKSGAGVLTLSAGSTATLTIDSSTRLDGAGAASGDVLTFNGTAYAPVAPSSITGSGATNRVAYWSSSSALSSNAAFTYDGTAVKINHDGNTIGTTTAVANTTLTVTGADTSTGHFSLYCRDSSNAGIFSVQNNGTVAVDSGPLWVGGSAMLGGRATGWGSPTGTATRTTFATSTVTLVQLAERVKALIDDLSSAVGTNYIIGP